MTERARKRDKQLGLPRSKTAYRDGCPVDRRYAVNDPTHRPRPESEKKRPEKVPLTERTRYTALCARCGGEFVGLADSSGRQRSDLHCPRCIAQAIAINVAYHERWKEKAFKRHPEYRKTVRCLRCSWSAEITTKYPKGGWVCGVNPSHPVVAE